MNIDLSTLGPLAGSLARAGLPALGTILGAVLPPPFDIVASGAFKLIAMAMGVDPASPTAPAEVQTAVDADPAAAASKLQTIEQAHKDAADAVNEELRIRTADIQNARSTEVQLVQAGSKIAWAPAIISIIVVLGFYLTIAALLFFKGDMTENQATLLNILVGIEATSYAGVIAFWIGSSSSSKNKDEALIGMARQPQVIQGPGSHVSGGVAPAKRTTR